MTCCATGDEVSGAGRLFGWITRMGGTRWLEPRFQPGDRASGRQLQRRWHKSPERVRLSAHGVLSRPGRIVGDVNNTWVAKSMRVIAGRCVSVHRRDGGWGRGWMRMGVVVAIADIGDEVRKPIRQAKRGIA